MLFPQSTNVLREVANGLEQLEAESTKEVASLSPAIEIAFVKGLLYLREAEKKREAVKVFQKVGKRQLASCFQPSATSCHKAFQEKKAKRFPAFFG